VSKREHVPTVDAQLNGKLKPFFPFTLPSMMIYLDDESYLGFPMRIKTFYTIHATLIFLDGHKLCKTFRGIRLTLWKGQNLSHLNSWGLHRRYLAWYVSSPLVFDPFIHCPHLDDDLTIKDKHMSELTR